MKKSLLPASILVLTACHTVTYTEKKDEIKASMLVELPSDFDPVIGEKLAECVSTVAVELADKLDCKVPDKYVDLRVPLAQCIDEKGAVSILQKKLNACLLGLQKELEQNLPVEESI